MSSVIEIISDTSIDTTTTVGEVNLTQKDPLLCGFINITNDEHTYDLILSACMFMKQFTPFNIRLFDVNTMENDILTFVRVKTEEPAYFVCRMNLGNDKDITNETIAKELQIHLHKWVPQGQGLEIMYDDENILIVG